MKFNEQSQLASVSSRPGKEDSNDLLIRLERYRYAGLTLSG
jgi:hypothetical protein